MIKYLALVVLLLLPISLQGSYDNPGNIIKGETWKGEVECSRARFECFSSPYWGIRAILLNLKTYYYIHNLRTVRGIISRWAPEHENPTENYIRFVSGYMGNNPDDTLEFTSTSISQLVMAIIIFENGQLLYPEKFIRMVIEAVFTELKEIRYASVRADNPFGQHSIRWSFKTMGNVSTS